MPPKRCRRWRATRRSRKPRRASSLQKNLRREPPRVSWSQLTPIAEMLRCGACDLSPAVRGVFQQTLFRFTPADSWFPAAARPQPGALAVVAMAVPALDRCWLGLPPQGAPGPGVALRKHWLTSRPDRRAPVAASTPTTPAATCVGQGSSADDSAAPGVLQQTPERLPKNLRGEPTGGQRSPVAESLLRGAWELRHALPGVFQQIPKRLLSSHRGEPRRLRLGTLTPVAARPACAARAPRPGRRGIFPQPVDGHLAVRWCGWCCGGHTESGPAAAALAWIGAAQRQGLDRGWPRAPCRAIGCRCGRQHSPLSRWRRGTHAGRVRAVPPGPSLLESQRAAWSWPPSSPPSGLAPPAAWHGSAKASRGGSSAIACRDCATRRAGLRRIQPAADPIPAALQHLVWPGPGPLIRPCRG